MKIRPSIRRARLLVMVPALALMAAPGMPAPALAAAGSGPGGQHVLVPGDLLVSESYYQTDQGLVAGQTVLPPGCTSGCATAIADGTYPGAFNNDAVDGSFGITSRLYLQEIRPDGRVAALIKVPDSDLVTSFSSKSEGALNLSTNGRYVTFIDYATAPDEIDVSNSNTPGAIDPTNPVPGAYYRAVARLSANGTFHFTTTNAYSGNNGRAAIEATVDGKDYIYTAGNAGNGGTPQPDGVILGAGAQIITPSNLPAADQAPGTPTPVGSFSVSELGDKADKVGKDDNFRGLTIYHNVLYYTKGSGGNGVDTVYFLDTTGRACPTGTGVPEPGAKLPTTGLSYDLSTLQANGLPSNMCILKGFGTALAKNATDSSDYPFGMWFANPTTLYVADEGSGDNAYANGSYTAAAASTTAGLQKWVYNSAAGQWQLAYTLSSGLNLGVPYQVPGYPTGVNSVTGLPWAPATDGLRNITGRVNPDGTVTIWAVTSTVSGGGDQGADPNRLVAITDHLRATAPATGEVFRTVRAPRFGQVVRGVCFTPGTGTG